MHITATSRRTVPQELQIPFFDGWPLIYCTLY